MAAIGVGGTAFSAHLGGFAARAAAGLLMGYQGRWGWRLPQDSLTREGPQAMRDAALWSEVAEYCARTALSILPPAAFPNGCAARAGSPTRTKPPHCSAGTRAS
jgi:hypothetical protein